ncbi:AEC family transporter [Phreatobacter stygius]|uniref:AEC family transporter n=1 Tax=Phreatobacter stygius TaxID=1940610 RepID=A0A4D7B3N0_9HYPH|nr:AEC family transporter [Phreatobacter stygius]QCI68389.1 AEC family transporter [Phreatobacter stygius]
MIQVLNLAMPFFGLIALGFFTARFKAWRGTAIPESGLAWMNFFLIYVALPALFYRILAKTPLEKLNNVPFVVGTTLATYTVFALGFAYVMWRSRGNMRFATVAGVCAAYGNIGYMGPGLAFSTIGPEAAVPVALIFCFDNILLFSLVPLLMALSGGSRRSLGSIMLETTVGIISHPFILATLAGVASAMVKFEPPEMLDRLLAFLQSAAAPVALFTLGVTVALRMESFAALARVATAISPILILKLIIHPVLVIVILSALGTFEPSWIFTAALMACLPPALNVFIIARHYDTWVEEASNAVLLGTVVSVVTLTSVLYLVKHEMLPINLFPA